MNFVITNEAALDLESIWLYTIETWSAEQADKYLNLIFNEIEYLSENPNSGIDFSHTRKGYLRSKINYHFIFYKVNSRKGEIEIIRILHEQMDIENHLL